MTYLSEILWLTTWPITIALGYYVARYALRKFESNLTEEEKK